MVDQSSLWLQYLEQLNTIVALQPGEALQAIYPFQPWDWGGQSPMPNSYSYEQWSVLNVVPSAPYLNSNTSPASQSGFDTAYSNWMNTLAIGDLAKDPHYTSLQAQVAAAAAKLTTDNQSAMDVWQNQTGGTGETFEAWKADPQNLGYVAQLNADALALSGLETELTNYQEQIVSPVQAIQTAFNNVAFQTAVTNPNSGKTVQVRIWGTSPPTPWAYLENITNNDFGGKATAGNPRSFTLDQTSSQYDYEETSTEGGGAFWDDFIGIEAGGEYSKVDWSQFDSEYSVAFSFQDLTTVPVLPDAWYQGADVASYSQGPYSAGFSAFDSGAGNFYFGVGGALSRIYTDLIVAYRPKVVITAGSDFTTSLQEKWKAEAGIEIGPFFFGSETSGEKTSSTVTVSDASLVLESTANWPVIIGMKSAWTVAPGK
jgi:hypothetical protein